MAAAPPPPVRTRPSYAATVALAVVLAAAAFAVVAAVILTVDRPTRLPPPFPDQNQDAETASYAVAFLVILPLALLAAARLARRPDALGLGGILAGLLAVAIGAVRLAGALGAGDGVHEVLAAAAAWWIAAAILIARPPSAATRRPGVAWAVAGVLGLGLLACFTRLGSINVPALAVGAVAAVGVVLAAGRLRLPVLPRGAGLAVDVALLGVLVLAVPDLLIFRPEQAPGNVAIGIETGIIRFHQDFLLGPANEVLHGHALLVDTASQYGVGSIYLVAAWSKLLGIGYGTFGALDDGLTALWFAAAYLVLRAAGVSRLLAGSALAVAAVALVFNLAYPVGSLPQYGPLRFGMPMAVLLAVVAGARWPQHARAARVAALTVTGISAIFSLEALAWTAVVYAATVVLEAWLRPDGRLRWAAVQAGLLAGSWIAAHVAFALATLAATGSLPDWGQYLAYLHAFLIGNVGDLTYDVPRWSAGLPVGAACLASAAALLELARRRHPVLGRERPAAVALAGLTAYAFVLVSYWVDRSLGHILVHVALPVLMLGTVWLSLALRADEVPRTVRRGALAFALGVTALVVAAAWPAVGDRFPRTALAHAVPGGSSLRGALARLRHPPSMSGSAPAGVAMLDRWMPGEDESLLMVSPDLGLEVAFRARRVDELPLGDPLEASFVVDERLPPLAGAVAALRPGRRMLLDTAAVTNLEQLRADPALDPLHNPKGGLAPLQQWALKRIDQRFRLRRIAASGQFSVYALDPR